MVFSGEPLEFKAGQTMSFSAATTKDFQFVDVQWQKEFSDIEVYLETRTPYPKTITFDVSLSLKEFFFEAGNAANIIFSKQITPNIASSFRLKISFSLVDKLANYCIINADLGNIVIKSDHPDIIPPLVRGISFSKSEYRPGEEVAVTFKMSEPLKTPESNHVEFMNPDLPYDASQPRGFPGYLEDAVYHLIVMPNGDYLLKFTVPANVVPGKYYLKWFNRYDIFDNFEDSVGDVDLQEKHVSTLTPLVVKEK